MWKAQMFENRSLRVDVANLVLLACATFLAVAVATHDRADPVGSLGIPGYSPDVSVYPQNEAFQNACGPAGAFAADVLLTSLGAGAFYLLASLFVLVYFLFRGGHIDSPVMRGVGWGISLAGVCGLCTTLVRHWSPGPVIGPGGYLGKLGHVFLDAHFATTGGVILAGCFTIAGIMLCTDYTIFKLIAKVSALFAILFYRRERLAMAPTPFVAPPKTNSLAIRVGNKRTTVNDVESDEDSDEDSDEEEGEDAESEKGGWLNAIKGEEGKGIPLVPASKAAGKAAKALSATLGVSDASAESTNTTTPAAEPKVKNSKERRVAESAEMKQKLDEATIATTAIEYQLPSLDLLQQADDIDVESQMSDVKKKAKLIEKALLDFGMNVKVVEIETGPVIAQYEVDLAKGLRVSKVAGLADDLAIALRVPSVRVVAPIPGKNTVGIEVPNTERQTVRMREVIEEANGRVKKMGIPLFLGKDVAGNSLLADLSKLPHLLIAGSTGTGKSVCLNTIICSILMTRKPDETRLLMIDPKQVELSGYGRLPHLMHPVVTDPKKAEAILNWAVEKMEERYTLLARAGVRHVSGYNQLGEAELLQRLQPETEEDRKSLPLSLPFIVIVVDEFADLMMTCGKEVEQHIQRLAQKSRAVGIHLILATQKPTVDVITGLIKSNLPARICFKVTNRTDSRVVLDEMGADKLLGMGDMLFLAPGTSQLLRGQGTYLSDDEINTIVDFVSTGEQHFVHELVNLKVEEEGGEGAPDAETIKKRDPLYEGAIEVVIREGRGSCSLLQRALGIGYGRAARLIDFMAEDGIVGHYAGSQAREVLLTLDQWRRMQGGKGDSFDEDSGDESEPLDRPVLPKRNKVRLESSSSASQSSREIDKREFFGATDAPWDEDDESDYEEPSEEESTEDEDDTDEGNDNYRANSA